MSKKIKIEVSYRYEIEVDCESEIVDKYKCTYDLFDDLVHSQFKDLPVIGNGVGIKDIEVLDYKIINK